MANPVILVLMCFAFSLIPAAVVAVVLFLRFEMVRGDVRAVTDVAKRTSNDLVYAEEELHTVSNRVGEVVADTASVKASMRGYEESFTRLSNKIASRESADRRKEAKHAGEVQPDDVLPDGAVIPVGNHERFNALRALDAQNKNEQQQPAKRQFGRLN
jgi:hypothetical protein